MAIVDFPGLFPVPLEGMNLTSAPSFTGSIWVLDAASEKVGLVFYAPKAGQIAKVSIRFGTVTTGATLDGRLETVSLSTGNPTGTLFGTNTNGALVVANGDDDATLVATMTQNATVARGDLIAFVISNPAASFGNMQIVYPNQTQSPFSFCSSAYPLFHNGTSWAKQDFTLAPCFGIEYSDGSYAPILPIQPLHSFTSHSFANNSNPNHLALRFRFPFPVRPWGAWIGANLTGECKLILAGDNWNGTDGDAVAITNTLDPDVRVANAARPAAIPFTSGTAELAANTTYRLILKPTTTTAVTAYSMGVSDADRWGQFSAGPEFYFSSAQNPNDSTDWTNTTTERPIWGLLLGGNDAGGAAGGLLTHPGMAGGMRG